MINMKYELWNGIYTYDECEVKRETKSAPNSNTVQADNNTKHSPEHANT